MHIAQEQSQVMMGIKILPKQNSKFFDKNSTFIQNNDMRAVLKIFYIFFRFCKIKFY